MESGDLFSIIAMILLPLLAGLFAGWWLAQKNTRKMTDERDIALREKQELSEKFNLAIRDLATAEERAAQAADLRAQLNNAMAQYDRARDHMAQLQEKIARFEADHSHHDKQLTLLEQARKEAREQMQQQFGEISTELLSKAQKAFLERAEQRFLQSEEKQEAKLKNTLAPVEEKLKIYEQSVMKVEKERNEAYVDLKALMGEMKEGQNKVQEEARNLVNSLRNAPKARGRWGEHQLRNVLESCGLAEHIDFNLEVNVKSGEQNLRPDAIINIPGGQCLVIDAKVSLNAYQDAYAAESDEQRDNFLTVHSQAMKNHVKGLAQKAYWNQFDNTPDYVVMFVPGEHFLSAALEYDPELWDFAFNNKVLLATPTNLVAIARTIAGVWRQEAMAETAREIGILGKELYERLAVAAEHLTKMGNNLDKTVFNYNQLVGSFESKLLTTGRRFKELNVDTGKKGEIEELPTIERQARALTKDI